MDTSHERDILIPSRTLKEHDFTNLTADQAATSAVLDWRMFFAWHLGNVWIFFFHSLPLAVLGLIVTITLEILFFRPRH
jgi:hypothetical protein